MGTSLVNVKACLLLQKAKLLGNKSDLTVLHDLEWVETHQWKSVCLGTYGESRKSYDKALPNHRVKQTYQYIGEVLHPCSCHMYVYTYTQTQPELTVGWPTLSMIRYIEYSSLSRDPIHQKMKVGQIINIYLAKVTTYTKNV